MSKAAQNSADLRSHESGASSKTGASTNEGDLPHYYVGKNSSKTSGNAGNTQSYPDLKNNQQESSASSKKQSTTMGNMSTDEMLDKSVKLGNDRYTIKGYFKCGNKELFALECERSITGYDGKCPECRKQHISLDTRRGFYVEIKSIYDAIGQQNLEKERLQGRKDIDGLKRETRNLPPLDYAILGENKGIEGDSNSCYMDSTIFCMFAYSNVFDSLLHVQTNEKSVEQLQTLLRENIVHVLRSNVGFVERDALYNLRAKLSDATGDQSFLEMEKDPSEFLRALEGLFQFAPLKTIAPDQPPNETSSNITTNIIWEMFDVNPQNLRSTNIASLFRNSLAEIPAKLATIPPFLILVAPRHTRSQRSYRYIVPDRQITLDEKVIQFVCKMCKKTNHDRETSKDFYVCDACFAKESPSTKSSDTDAKVSCYCTACLSRLHKDLASELPNHNSRRIPIGNHKLDLFAVLCIETSHYVAFVKCQKSGGGQHEWVFFDSMSDRIHNEKNIPRVDLVPDFDRWIDRAQTDQYFFEDLDNLRSQARPSSQKFSESSMRQLRLFRDGAFFFYQNSNVNYQ